MKHMGCVTVNKLAHIVIDKSQGCILYLVVSRKFAYPQLLMAVKAVFNSDSGKNKKKKERAKDSGMKPLAKYYLDDHPDEEGKSFFVFQARLTPKGFLLLICKDFTLMYPGGMTEASTLLDDIFPKLHGKEANRLCCVLSKANRFGAYLATDDEHKCFYSYDAEEEILLTSKEPIQQEKKQAQSGLTLKDFGIDTSVK